MFGEQGNAEQNWDPQSALRMRLRSWTAFFEEGTLIFWNSSFAKDYKSSGAANIYLGPTERRYIHNLQSFASGADPNLTPFNPQTSNPAVRAYGLQSDGTVLIYLHHFASHGYPAVSNLTINFRAPGKAAWIDPASGKTLSSFGIKSGNQVITTPAFKVDLALRILKNT